ncbi:MAG TPA: hypothetical protein VLK33_08950, partial [Terriglobales bacterium]|nr:hypothetical protein [Terriglobales bacterium]
MAESKSSPSPAWLYRFLSWVESTPLKGTLLVAMLLVVGAVLNHLPYWRHGLLAQYEFNPDRLIEACWLPLNILIWLAMDRLAVTTLNDFGKTLGK